MMKLPFNFDKKLNLQRLGLKKNSTDNEDIALLDDNQPIQGLSDLYLPEDSIDVQQQEPVSVIIEEPKEPEVVEQPKEKDIIDILVEMGELALERVQSIRDKLQKGGSSTEQQIISVLIANSVVDDKVLCQARAKLHNLEFVNIEPSSVSKEVFEKLEIDFIKSNFICPLSIKENKLVVAITEPGNLYLLEDIKKLTQMDIIAVMSTEEDIDAICKSFAEEKNDYCVDEIISDMADVEVVHETEEASEDLERMAGQSPVIKFVNYLISNAIHEGASDIHIEPKEKITRIRYRIDGVLFETMQSPLKMHPAVVSRIKIMSNLDISERRVPQDGKISVIVGGREVDLRVSILPTSHGEKVVIRLLDRKSILRGLDQLGMEPDIKEAFAGQIELPHGILLVTGPTGSGKSTTLYSAMGQMDGNKMNISTVEDPVEYQLGFCNQVQVNEKTGMTFSAALRSLLRQDPDIIMIGEIRDAETARIAVQAALTGHLVLSTLHTNDAPSSVTRLVNIGIDAYLIAASLNGILAQRLVRKICSKCKEPFKVPPSMLKHIEATGVKKDEIFHGAGCDLCRNSGYVGRVGIYELLVIDEKFRDIINQDVSANNMRKAFIESGQPTLFHDGIKKVKQGLTTIEEVMRVTEIYNKGKESTENQ